MATKLHVYGYIVMYGCGSWTLRKNEETRLDSFEMKGLRKILWFCGQQRKQWVGSQQSWSKEETVRHCQSKKTSILWSHHEETRELPGKRHNAWNNARCMQARKPTRRLDGQRQDVDRTTHGRVNQMTEDRDKWRKYVYGVANPQIEDG